MMTYKTYAPKIYHWVSLGIKAFATSPIAHTKSVNTARAKTVNPVSLSRLSMINCSFFYGLGQGFFNGPSQFESFINTTSWQATFLAPCGNALSFAIKCKDNVTSCVSGLFLRGRPFNVARGIVPGIFDSIYRVARSWPRPNICYKFFKACKDNANPTATVIMIFRTVPIIASVSKPYPSIMLGSLSGPMKMVALLTATRLRAASNNIIPHSPADFPAITAATPHSSTALFAPRPNHNEIIKSLTSKVDNSGSSHFALQYREYAFQDSRNSAAVLEPRISGLVAAIPYSGIN